MKQFEDFVDGINAEIHIPDIVNRKFEGAFDRLDVVNQKHEEVFDKLDEMKPKMRGNWMKWSKVAAIVIAVGVIGSVTLVLNPAMASNIPIIGNIFQTVQDKIRYSGDYSKKQVLTEKNAQDSILMAEDKGIKITASEVYSDGFSVYVTMKMDSQKYDFSRIPELAETGGKSVVMATSYGINSNAGMYDYDISLDGVNNGKHIFIGMMKFDKADYSLKDGYMNIKIKEIYFDNAQDETDNELKTISGDWQLKIPYETDTENGKEIVVNQKTENGLQVKKLFISPYQLVVLTEVPYMMPYADMPEEEIAKKYKKKLGEDYNDSFVESLRSTKRYEYYEMAVFDQDGNVLDWESMGAGEEELEREMYSVRGKEISSVHIYITQDEDNVFNLIKAKTEEEAKQFSEYDFKVDIQ